MTVSGDQERRSDEAALSTMQREWFEGIVRPYLDGRQDGCEWALIDNARGDELRFALQALIVIHRAAVARADDEKQRADELAKELVQAQRDLSEQIDYAGTLLERADRAEAEVARFVDDYCTLAEELGAEHERLLAARTELATTREAIRNSLRHIGSCRVCRAWQNDCCAPTCSAGCGARADYRYVHEAAAALSGGERATPMSSDPCADCHHPLNRHIASGEGLCLDCRCLGWRGPSVVADEPQEQKPS
jgi:hypothetical protein